MARLNNTPSPRKREYPRRALKLPSRLERGLSEGLFARATGENETTTTTKSSYLSSSASSREGVLGGKQPQSQGKKTRKGKNSDGADFPIFYDSDALFEREAEETDNDDDSDDDNENREGEEEEEEEGTSGSPASSSLFSSSRSSESSGASAHSHAPKATISKDPLKLTHVNSLLLSGSVFQQARNHRHRRAPRKSETIDYDKENDPVELPGDEEEERQTQREGDTVLHLTRNSSDASSRRVPGRRDSRQTVGRNNGLFSTYRRQQPREHDMEEEEDEEEGTSEDNGSDDDSLDDFIVSDNEEVSYHETSSVDGETEDEDEGKKIQRIPSSPHSPPKPRRRLMRGRRPAAKQESESEEEAKAEPEPEVKKSWKAPSNKEQLPIGDTIRCSTPGSRHSQMSQKGFNIAEELDHLNLDDNDASCQLVQDLNDVVTNLDSPAKKPVPTELPKPQTPPSSPSKNNRLRSPTKGKVRIPPTPYRESTDAFWSQETTNDWVDQHSPSKVEQLLREFEDSDDDNDNKKETSLDIMPRSREVKQAPKAPKTPSKTAQKKAEIEHKKALLARKKSFDDKKAGFAYEFLKTLDSAVTGGQVQEMAQETGGVKIIWSKTLQTTAGRATWRRANNTDNTDKPAKQYASIELAERIIDNDDRLINTLAHEYCHLANNMISKVYNHPHGTSFKQWGLKCKQALQDHPVYAGRVEVTTKHNYKIDYKYVWACVDCAQSFGRHSKSIDPGRVRCGRCKGILQQIKPKPRNASPKKKTRAACSGFGAAQGGSVSPVGREGVDDVMQVLGGVSLN